MPWRRPSGKGAKCLNAVGEKSRFHMSQPAHRSTMVTVTLWPLYVARTFLPQILNVVAARAMSAAGGKHG